MRRRVRLSRLTGWTVIAAGPIALGLALTSTPTTVAAAAAKPPATVHTTSTANPAGYAQLFIHTWLRSSADDATSAQARLAQSMAPGIDPRDQLRRTARGAARLGRQREGPALRDP
ncbi:hypothetical protein ACF08O_08070 [Streptomyces paradoxus]|uniref:hypothetical protein n=1 Tax=Streptomyces paradoxus TaxID=66375 RepID=UPI0036F8E624